MEVKETEKKKLPYIIGISFLMMSVLAWLDISQWRENINLEKKSKEYIQKYEKAKQAKERVKIFEETGGEKLKKEEKYIEEILPLNDLDILDTLERLSGIGKKAGVTRIDFNTRKLVKVSQKKSSSQSMGNDMGPRMGGPPSSSGGGGMDSQSMGSGMGGQSGMGNLQQSFQTGENNNALVLYKYPIDIEFKGTYRQIAEFIIGIVNIKRLMTVDNLRISRSEKNLPYLSCSLVVNVYTFLAK